MDKNDKTISNEMLKDLGVYELRELARSIGVQSPTTKKRAELCEQILKISSGEMKSEIKRTNKGRPPKTVTKIASFVNKFIPEEVLKLQKSPELNSGILTFAQTPISVSKYSNEEQVLGYINSINGHSYIKNLKIYNEFKDLIFYIPNELVQKHSFRDGDKILATGKMAETCYCGVIDEILEVNNKSIEEYQLKNREVRDLFSFEIPSIPEKLFNKEIKKGERILAFFNNQEEAIVKLLEEIEKTEDKVIFLGLELAPEIIYYIKSKGNIESFTTSFYNTLEESYETIINSINHATSLLKEGISIKFVIFDMMGILSRLDIYYINETNKYLNHSVSSIQLLKRLIGTGKAFTKDLHLTTIAISFKEEKQDEFIQSEIEKVFSKIIV